MHPNNKFQILLAFPNLQATKISSIPRKPFTANIESNLVLIISLNFLSWLLKVIPSHIYISQDIEPYC